MVDVAASLDSAAVLAAARTGRFRHLSWPLGALGLLIPAGTAALLYLNRSAIHSFNQVGLVELILPIGYAVIGALLASRRPSNPIGWLFLGIAIFTGLPGIATQYVFRNWHFHHLAGAPWVAWTHDLMGWLVFPSGFAFFFFLLFPNGRLQSPRWKWVAWAGALCLAVGAGLQMVAGPIKLTGSPAMHNPTGVDLVSFNGPAGTGLYLLGLGFVLTAMAGTVVRTRHATGELRQQLRWLSYATAATATGLFVVIVASLSYHNLPNAVWDVVILFGFAVAVPVCCGIAILKHGLYDLDVVVSKTVVYGVLAAFFTAVYVAVVVGIGTAVGSTRNPLLTVLAAVLIALAFNPVRERAKHLANRIVYGKRATPYEVLSEFSHGLAGASSADEALSRMARLVVEATGASRATVWLPLGGMLQPEASWPPDTAVPEPIPLDGRSVEEVLAGASAEARPFLVKHDDELLGVLTVVPSPSEPLTVSGEKLITDLATQTGLGLQFERMKERALFAKALASFLPPEVAELVEASPSALALREEVEATILFSDIRGFSTLAEQLSPGEIADVIGRHLGAMAEVVTSQGGTLDKFGGDAVMAVFGVPRKVADHAERGVACAVAMQQRQSVLNTEAEALGLPASELGIGVNTGIVIAGTIGGTGRLDYTVLGDAVNVAQRLQSEAVGGEILASAATVVRAGAPDVEPAGLRRLKGREEPVEAHRVRWQPLAAPLGEAG